jgi:hypothetical protein
MLNLLPFTLIFKLNPLKDLQIFAMHHFQTVLFCLIVFLMAELKSYAQDPSESRFGFGVFIGLNASQIDGDNSYGYNKLGLSGGIRTRIFLKNYLEAQSGISYSNQGAQSVFLSKSSFDMKIDLQYIVVPLEIHFKDWLQESDYYKIHYLIGLNYSRLFNYTVRDGGLGLPDDHYNLNDVSGVVGIQYLFNPHLGVGLKYFRSINLLYNRDRVTGSTYRSMIGYFLQLQLFYHL